MHDFTAQVHVTGSAQNLAADREFIEVIIQTVYANRAMVFRNWVGAAQSRQSQQIKDNDVDWESIYSENMESIKKSDLVIIEASQERFSQGIQAYTAAQHKKPTLIVSRSQIKERFISGVGSKYITVKHYSTADELRAIVTKFIKQNIIPDKDLRFNMVLDRRIYKYLSDTSYETGKNKSQIVRSLLEKENEKRK